MLPLYLLNKKEEEEGGGEAASQVNPPSTMISALKITKCTHQRIRIPQIGEGQTGGGGERRLLLTSVYTQYVC